MMRAAAWIFDDSNHCGEKKQRDSYAFQISAAHKCGVISQDLAEAERALDVRWYPVVAHQRVGESKQLAVVRRVGQGLGVAHHTSLEHYEGEIKKNW